MDDDDIRAVEAAVATLESASAEHEPAAITLQSAVAAAVTHGKPIRDVAAAAHMTVMYPRQALQPSSVA